MDLLQRLLRLCKELSNLKAVLKLMEFLDLLQRLWCKTRTGQHA